MKYLYYLAQAHSDDMIFSDFDLVTRDFPAEGIVCLKKHFVFVYLKCILLINMLP